MSDPPPLFPAADGFVPLPPAQVYGRLAPLRIGEALRAGFGTWARNLVGFTTMSVLLHAPLIVWGLLLLRDRWNVVAWARFGLWTTCIAYLLGGLLSAMVTYAVACQLERMPASVGRVIGVGLRRCLPALLTAFVASLLVAVATLAVIFPGLIVSCMFYVAMPASVVERLGIRGALRRSRELTKGNRWRIFALLVLTFLITTVPPAILHVILFGGGDEVKHLQPVATVACSLITAPLTAAIVAATYVLLRRERDGVDTATIAAVFE